MTTVLALQQVVAYIEGTQVLRGVSLEVAKGETVALIGRNGAGKTSLIRTVMGVLPLRSGQIMFNGTDLGRAPGHLRPVLGIGYAPEERRLIGKFTVLDNILLPAWACGLSRSVRSEEHTSELQSRGHLVCRLLLEKKNIIRHEPIWAKHRKSESRRLKDTH